MFKIAFQLPSVQRAISISQRCSFNTSAACLNNEQSMQQGWLSKLFVRKIEPGSDPHSRLLSESEMVYELQIHNVKPGKMEKYFKESKNLLGEIKDKTKGCDLVASFKVLIGDQDQVVNIWRYSKGWTTAHETYKILNEDSVLKKLTNEQNETLRDRQNQFMMLFSFWNPPEPSVRNCFYEMRSYTLKPGTMIEWGNSWARGIHVRQNKVAGYFSQIGQLYVVHHIWHYEDLPNRKEVRENAWRNPGWDEIVGNTVPLIREMNTRWMVGNDYSPIR